MPNPVILRRPLAALYRTCVRFDAVTFPGTLFDTSPGAPVLACANARVIKTGQSADGRKNLWLWCELPGVTCRVFYDGLGKLAVRVGDRLKTDDQIGTSAAAAGFRIARVYVEVRAFPGDVAVEPDWYDDYVDQRIMRALPS